MRRTEAVGDGQGEELHALRKQQPRRRETILLSSLQFPGYPTTSISCPIPRLELALQQKTQALNQSGLGS